MVIIGGFWGKEPFINNIVTPLPIQKETDQTKKV